MLRRLAGTKSINASEPLDDSHAFASPQPHIPTLMRGEGEGGLALQPQRSTLPMSIGAFPRRYSPNGGGSYMAIVYLTYRG